MANPVTYGAALALGAAMLAIDVIAAAMLAAVVAWSGWLAIRGEMATGHVVKIEPGQRRTARVRVAYETPTGTFEARGTSRRRHLGEPKAVRYDPAHPARVTTMVRPARTALTGGAVILALAVTALGLVTGSVYYFAGTHERLQVPLAGGGFALLCTLMAALFAGGKYAELLRCRRRVQAAGTVKRFDEHAPGGPGILISFHSADGRDEFWARAGSVTAGVGDGVTVYYDPAAPAGTATVQTAADVRAWAIGGTVFALAFAGITIAALSLL